MRRFSLIFALLGVFSLVACAISPDFEDKEENIDTSMDAGNVFQPANPDMGVQDGGLPGSEGTGNPNMNSMQMQNMQKQIMQQMQQNMMNMKSRGKTGGGTSGGGSSGGVIQQGGEMGSLGGSPPQF